MNTVELGNNGPQISEMGIGTWAWGDRLFWNYGRDYGKEDLRKVYQLCIEAGITFFDTAEVYGSGRSEKFLGEFAQSSPNQAFIASKFFPYPWRLRGKSLRRALTNSLKRLGRQQIELYQIHWPNPPVSVQSWMHAMADAKEAKLIQHIGLSNYSPQQTERAYLVLESRGHALASNQVRYSLIARGQEFNGLLQLCRELSVSVIAYSPLGQGLLSGKYSPSNPPGGARRLRYSTAELQRALMIVEELKRIGEKHEGKSAVQVAINWTIQKGTIPIPGAKNRRQAEENLGAVGWVMSEEETDRLDEMSAVSAS